MARISTVARPYAKAVFELALQSRELAGWQDQLEALALIAADPAMRAALASPKVTPEQLAGAMIDVAGAALKPQGANLVRLLAGRKRLAALPDILAQFVLLRREAEKKAEVEVRSAAKLGDAQRAAIKAALEKRLGRAVELVETLDPKLIGGAVVRAGDLVIDASVAGRLARLGTALLH